MISSATTWGEEAKSKLHMQHSIVVLCVFLVFQKNDARNLQLL